MPNGRTEVVTGTLEDHARGSVPGWNLIQGFTTNSKVLDN